MSLNDHTVEEWAGTAYFPLPLRLGAVEAGVLARRPAASAGLGWGYPLLVVLGWVALALSFLLGLGVALVGLLAVWLGTSDDPPSGHDFWLSMAQMIFVVGAIVEILILLEAVKSKERESFLLGSALLTGCASAAAFLLLRSSPRDEPWGLTPAVIAQCVLSIGVIIASMVAKPRTPGPNAARKSPKRGLKNDNKYWHYVRTRTQVLDTLIDRELLKVDDADRRRLNEMPLGYWEELDYVDEREWRRILEYRFVGWREFTEGDRWDWSPPEKRT